MLYSWDFYELILLFNNCGCFSVWKALLQKIQNKQFAYKKSLNLYLTTIRTVHDVICKTVPIQSQRIIKIFSLYRYSICSEQVIICVHVTAQDFSLLISNYRLDPLTVPVSEACHTSSLSACETFSAAWLYNNSTDSFIPKSASSLVLPSLSPVMLLTVK